MADCLAAVITAFNQPLELQRVPIPELEPFSILARVDVTTLCGTDAHRWQGHQVDGGAAEGLPFLKPAVPPFVPGHEITGTIVEMRGPLTDLLDVLLKPGDRIISSYPHCGHCYYCTIAGQTMLCPNCLCFSHSRCDEAPYLLGGCAEFHYFPPRGSFIRVPDEVPAPLAASASCALRTVMHGFEQLGVIASHETVLVQGCGPLGLYALAVAKDRGARRVLLIGAPEARLEVAREWGADAVLDLEKVTAVKDRVAWAREHTAGRGPDIVLQCANSPALVEGLELIRPGGRLISIGGSGGTLSIPPMLFFKGVQIRSVVMNEARHSYQAIDFLATRRKQFSFDKIISGTYTLDRTTDALRAMAVFREVKPVILPRVAQANA